MGDKEMTDVMIVLSQMNKAKNVVADVKRLQKLFWDDADIMATNEIQIITTKQWADKYKNDVQALADEKGYSMEIIEAPQQ
ncbi:hypothetical protein COT72_05030 [archaeon CG10_big_fil_rev_8_21_14_0_10_43_11]|nr:MAG: hypothetical protein COT72_05030 [archaeon CG10_big_fil_rev_8_21_14_0_10_43_11]